MTNRPVSKNANRKRRAGYPYPGKLKQIYGFVQQIFGFDRVTLWLDHADVQGLDDALRPHCYEYVLTPELMPNNPMWKCKLEIYQPSKAAFTAFLLCLGTKYRALVTYVELAWDVTCRTARQAREVEKWRLAHIYLPYSRQRVKRDKKSWYYKRRAEYMQGKRGYVLVMYADDGCKLWGVAYGKHCAHMELRFTGSAAMGGIGIFSLSELLALDHVGLWRRAIRFLELPNTKRSLGRLLHNQPHLEISDTALVNKANKLLNKHTKKGRFVLQNAIRKNKHLARKLTEIPFDDVIGDPARARLI